MAFTCLQLLCLFGNLFQFSRKKSKKKLQSFRNIRQYNHLQSAIKEANALVDVTNNKRMESCVFENADGKALVAELQMESREYTTLPINKSTNKDSYKNGNILFYYLFLILLKLSYFIFCLR